MDTAFIEIFHASAFSAHYGRYNHICFFIILDFCPLSGIFRSVLFKVLLDFPLRDLLFAAEHFRRELYFLVDK